MDAVARGQVPTPAFPTTSEKSALAPAARTATGRSERSCGTEATAPKPKTRNSGPGGCQSCAEDSTVPAAATSALPATVSHALESAAPTSAPSATTATSAVPALACIAARDR